ncbi:MAG: MaoC family dehydratase N-terminal domain-containing protein [Actinomycetes bacterium]
MTEIDFAKYIGQTTSSGVVTIERATVTSFAAAVLDTSKVYRNLDVAVSDGFTNIPTPPTYLFSAAQSYGQWEEEQPEIERGVSNPMAEVMGSLMATGGMILHGEQEFTYHRAVVVGEKLRQEGIVRDIYQKQKGDRTMTFVVIETTYTDSSEEVAVTTVMNLLHRS